MAKLSLKELQSLSRLLLSDDIVNIELGLNILNNHKTYTPIFYRELTLLYFLQNQSNLKDIAKKFLEDAQGSKKIQNLEKNFQVFHSLGHHYSYTPEVRKMFVEHENILEQFYEMIIDNKHYCMRYYRLAYKLHRRYNEQLDLAEKYYKMVLHSNPDHVSSLFHLAFLLSEKEDKIDEALKLYLKVLAINPKESAACSNIGLIYHSKEQYEKAYEYFHLALQQKQNDKTYLRNLARTCVEMDADKKEEGKMILQQLIEKYPTDGLLWNSWADYLWNVEQEYEEAEKAYQQGLGADPNNSYLLGNLGELYIDIYNKIDAGIVLYEKAIAKQCSSYRLITMISVYVHKKQNWAKAKKYYQMLVKEFAPKPIRRDSYLRDDQWETFLAAERLLKDNLKNTK